MLEQFIESTDQLERDHRREGFFLTSLSVVFSAVGLALIYSLFSYNLAMANENLDVAQLVAPVQPPAEVPAPPLEQSPRPDKNNMVKPTDQLPTHEINMQRPDEIPVSNPLEFSTAPNGHRARPEGGFNIDKVESDGSQTGIRTVGSGNGNSTGLNQTAITRSDEGTDTAETTQPPPITRKPADSAAKKPPQTGGVVNGKATKLVTPAYPNHARIAQASGTVNVQVLIDEEGNVLSANAVSGHPLLRQAAEQAARSSKFSPTYLSKQKVQVTGVIVYNFVPR